MIIHMLKCIVIVILFYACGQGAWEDEMIYSTTRMKELLDYKDIPAWIDFWGRDG